VMFTHKAYSSRKDMLSSRCPLGAWGPVCLVCHVIKTAIRDNLRHACSIVLVVLQKANCLSTSVPVVTRSYLKNRLCAVFCDAKAGFQHIGSTHNMI
jgi:hypothetical protein